ncbi:MAG: PAS domain S-box protein [Pseudomonadota bacterium]
MPDLDTIAGPSPDGADPNAGQIHLLLASLRASEARFRDLAGLSSDWYWEQDADGRLSHVSEELRHKSGIDPARMQGLRWRDVTALQPADGWEGLEAAMRARQTFRDMLMRYETGGPEAVYLSVSGIPVLAGDGTFAGYRGIGKDVSARERIDAAHRGTEERYRRIMDSARDGIMMVDSDGIVTFANRRMCVMLGTEADEICGRARDAFTLPLAPQQADADGAGGEGVELRRKDGTIVWAMEVSYPVTARDGSHAGTLSIFTDLTEFKDREERIRQLAVLAAEKGEAERANQAKSRFLAAVSHDLRQPMHALGLFIEDLRNAGLQGPEAVLLDRMESALELTNGLLDTILMMSGLESGMVTPDVVDFPVQRILDRAYHAFGAVAARKGLRLSIVPSAAIIRSDPVLLERVVFNLVSNAVRYTTRGGVAVGCRSRGPCVHIEVWDTGPGIAQEHHGAIFGEFVRLENQGRERGGLGLGLAIVQSCASLLAHPLQLKSVPGRGSRFSIFVPRGSAAGAVAAAVEDEAPVPAGTSFKGVRVLVIDDDVLLLESTSGLLRRWGCEVLEAVNGTEAVERLAAAGGQAGLIVSDLRLADGEVGTGVIATLRERFGAATPALILTGERSLQTAREVKAAGLTLLYKPVPPGRLKALMDQLLGLAHASQ